MKVRITLPSPPPSSVKVKIQVSPPQPPTMIEAPRVVDTAAPVTPKFKKGDIVRTIGGFHRNRNGEQIRVPSYLEGKVCAISKSGTFVYINWSSPSNPTLQWHHQDALEIDDPRTRPVHTAVVKEEKVQKAQPPRVAPRKVPPPDVLDEGDF